MFVCLFLSQLSEIIDAIVVGLSFYDMHICVPQINGKPLQYIFPHTRLKLLRDPKDHTVSGKKPSTRHDNLFD